MKITEIHIYAVNLPVSGQASYRMSMSDLTALDSTVVEIITDTGIKGYGEIGLLLVAFSLGVCIGPLLGGLSMEAWGASSLYWFCAASAAGLALVMRKTRSTCPAPQQVSP